ncbi:MULTISPECIES: hypothetical protein [Amycolatopsis]|uniref:DUF3618 domain-containing protein n=1 Tax=Amycolatopsis albidoflavus TaxID=102226 RepID=A0ABW5I5F4_9PSEU
MSPLPEQPTGGEILRAIGRVEKSVDGLGDQVRHMDDKLDGQGLTLASTVERMTTAERDIRELKAEKIADRAAAAQHASSMRVAVKGAIAAGGAGFVGSVVLLIVQLLTHH